jgi:predicted enzyme related to lactoylglutathione lyase
MALETRNMHHAATGTGNETLVAGLALFAHGPAELARFYEQVLRIAFEHRVHPDGREHWIAGMSGIQFEIKALVTGSGMSTADAFESAGSSGMSRSELSFRVDSVSAAAARALLAGGTLLQRAETHTWGTFAVVADPEGNRLGLFQPPTLEAGDTAAAGTSAAEASATNLDVEDQA